MCIDRKISFPDGNILPKVFHPFYPLPHYLVQSRKEKFQECVYLSNCGSRSSLFKSQKKIRINNTIV